MNLGFEGVEAFSSYHSQEQSARFCRMTRETGRFCTIGSDYHGRLKPAIFLGKVNFPEDIERVEIESQARVKLEKYCR